MKSIQLLSFVLVLNCSFSVSVYPTTIVFQNRSDSFSKYRIPFYAELYDKPEYTKTCSAPSIRLRDEPQKSGQTTKTEGRQKWGYVEVRPGAFMFYWLYYTEGTDDYTQKPWVIWLAGGPGDSSTGSANFEKIGPLDMTFKRREFSWVTEANVLLIDSPVGTGFSYVNNDNLLTQNTTQIASDLLQFITKFLQTNPTFQTIPLFIFGESYGGKMAAKFAAMLNNKIKEGKIKCYLKGLTVGGALISPLDSLLTWAPYLYATSMLDGIGRDEVNASAYRVKAALDKQQYQIAFDLRTETRNIIKNLTNGFNLFNILGPSTPPLTLGTIPTGKNLNIGSHPSHLLRKVAVDPMDGFMNATIRDMLKIIPNHIVYIQLNQTVGVALEEDRVKSGLNAVEKVLENADIAVNVCCGQLDHNTNNIGTLNWVESLMWTEIPGWQKSPRIPISLNGKTAMFVKSYKNFGFYWVLKAGHMIAGDQLQTSLRMLKLITNQKK